MTGKYGLPERPLTLKEGDSLANQEGSQVTPLSILFDTWEGREHTECPVYTLFAVTDDRGFVLGFSEERGEWVEAWSSSADDWDGAAMQEATQEFLHSEYGDEAGVGTIEIPEEAIEE